MKESIRESMARRESEQRRARIPAAMIAGGIWFALIGGLIVGGTLVLLGLAIAGTGIVWMTCLVGLESYEAHLERQSGDRDADRVEQPALEDPEAVARNTEKARAETEMGWLLVGSLLLGFVAANVAGPDVPFGVGWILMLGPMWLVLEGVAWRDENRPMRTKVVGLARTGGILAALALLSYLERSP